MDLGDVEIDLVPSCGIWSRLLVCAACWGKWVRSSGDISVVTVNGGKQTRKSMKVNQNWWEEWSGTRPTSCLQGTSSNGGRSGVGLDPPPAYRALAPMVGEVAWDWTHLLLTGH